MVSVMTKMKDSGIEYIGDIPYSWNICPLYCLFGERKNKNYALQENNLLSLSYGNIIRKDIDTVGGLLPASFNTYNIVEKDDIIIRPTDLQNDKRSLRTGLVKEKGIITSAYIDLKPSKGVNSAYYHYLLHAFDIMKVFYNMGNGVRQGLNFDEFSKLLILVPNKEEQAKIVSFLDAKCAEIDALSADIQSEIDTLQEYKRSVITEAVTKGLDKNAEIIDSRIYYTAPYNSKWRLSKIGYECTKLWRPFNSEDTALLCTNKGKVAIRPDEMSGIMVSQDNAMQGIHKGDIAIHGMDTWHGAIALSDYEGKITRVVHVCDSPNDNRFIVYYLQQLAYNGVYKLISNGVRGNTSDFRSWDKVADIYIALPSLDEQSKISDYLDSVCVQVEDIIAQKQEQLEVLADYKKSVIYEYVTGKKEVPAV